jgi:hypothetical protein
MNSELKWSRVGTKSQEKIGCRIQYNVCTTITTWKLFLYFTFYTESFVFVILNWFHLTNVMPLQNARLFSNCCLCQWFPVSSDSQSHKTVIRFLRTWPYSKFEVPTLRSMNIINSIVFWGVKMVAARFSTKLANVKILVLSVKYGLSLPIRSHVCKLRYYKQADRK